MASSGRNHTGELSFRNFCFVLFFRKLKFCQSFSACFFLCRMMFENPIMVSNFSQAFFLSWKLQAFEIPGLISLRFQTNTTTIPWRWVRRALHPINRGVALLTEIVVKSYYLFSKMVHFKPKYQNMIKSICQNFLDWGFSVFKRAYFLIVLLQFLNSNHSL